MKETQLKLFLSEARFEVYLATTAYDKAYKLYKSNVELSEAFYPVLAVLEISLRNAINEQMKIHYADPFWFQNHLPIAFQPFVNDATHKVLAQRKNVTCDRIIAELNFGFWNRLFNRSYTTVLWKPLRVNFKNLPKHLRQRDTIDNVLYRVRTLRNRIYHYKPIFRDLSDIEMQYKEMLTFLTWLDKDLPELLNGIDRFQEIYDKAK